MLAAQAAALTTEDVTGAPFGPLPTVDLGALPRNLKAAQVAGEAAALVELSHPGTMTAARLGDRAAAAQVEAAT